MVLNSRSQRERSTCYLAHIESLLSLRPPVQIRQMSDEQKVKLALELKQRELDLERNYSQKLLDVITARQMVSLKKAEGEFRDILIRRIQQQKMRRHQRDQIRKKLEDRRRD